MNYKMRITDPLNSNGIEIKTMWWADFSKIRYQHTEVTLKGRSALHVE